MFESDRGWWSSARFWLDSPITSGPNPRGHFRRRMGAAGVQHLPYHPVSLERKDKKLEGALVLSEFLFEWNLARLCCLLRHLDIIYTLL